MNQGFFRTDFSVYLRKLTDHFSDYLDRETAYISRSCNPCYSVLELGSGSGITMKSIAPYVKRLVGIDSERIQVENAQKRVKCFPNIEIFHQDGSKISFPDSSFHLSFMSFNTLGILGDKKIVSLKELGRVTKGNVILSVLNQDSTPKILEQYALWKFEELKINDTLVLGMDRQGTMLKTEVFSDKRLASLLDRAGFENYIIRPLNEFASIATCTTQKG